MAKYKHYDYSQGKFIPISFDKQILPGTFEHTLHYLIDNDLDLSAFDLRYKNDETGAPAYDPRILLKIVLYAYSKGITSSRKIADCCNENVIFMALSADTRPHFTTIADFISSNDQETMKLFLEVLLICDEMGLIGKEMFAVDGCKLPSNASKEWSGTKKELKHKKEKMEKAIRQIDHQAPGEGQDRDGQDGHREGRTVRRQPSRPRSKRSRTGWLKTTTSPAARANPGRATSPTTKAPR